MVISGLEDSGGFWRILEDVEDLEDSIFFSSRFQKWNFSIDFQKKKKWREILLTISPQLIPSDYPRDYNHLCNIIIMITIIFILSIFFFVCFF